MGNPILGADSVLDDPSVTVTASVAADAAFPLTNINNDRPWSPYRMGATSLTLSIEADAGFGNTITCDYFMLVGHDLFDPAKDGLGPITTLKFQHSADASSWFDIFTITPGSTPVGSIADNLIIARKTPLVTTRAFRLFIERPANAFIATLGELQFGKAVVIPTGMNTGFDPETESLNVRRTQSQDGNILGTTERYSNRSANIDLQLLDGSFVDGTDPGEFKDFWDNHASKMKGFLWQWNPDIDSFANPGQFEKQAFFAIIDPDTTIARPLRTQVDVGLRDISFSVTGLKEEQ